MQNRAGQSDFAGPGTGNASSPRILCFLHSFEPGGVERTALHLCTAWQDDGADVAVVLGRDEGRLRGESPNLSYLIPPPPRFSTASFETIWMLVWLPVMIRRWRPDILFCPGNSYTIVAVAMKLLLGARCPPIAAKISNDLTRGDLPLPLRCIYHLWCRIQGRLLDHLVALSPAMKDEVIAIMRVDSGRVSTIADAILEERQLPELTAAGRHARATRRRGRRFLAAGRLASQKNFPLMLHAFALGAAPDDRLVILGEGPQRPALERLIGRLGLEDRVCLPGHSDSMIPWFACSDILLLSSRYEGLPAIVVEALAAGLGVIATDCCVSMAALLDHGRRGELIPTADQSAFSSALAAIGFEDRSLESAIGYTSRFTVQAAAIQYLGVFVRLTGHLPMSAPQPSQRSLSIGAAQHAGRPHIQYDVGM